MNHKVVKKHSSAIKSTNGLPVKYDLYAPMIDSGSLPLIIFLHGFKGFKDWGTFPDAFIEIATQGFAVLAMNFSLCGVDSSSNEFNSLDLFRKQTISQELDDVRVVMDALRDGKIAAHANLLELFPVGILGHSRGALTAIIAASENDEIASLVTWGAVSDCLEIWDPAMIKEWETKGFTSVKNSRTGQVMEIDRTLFDDVKKNQSRFNGLERVKELYIPCYFIHGRADESVSHQHSQKLFETCSSREKERLIIDGANHTFGSMHPYDANELPPHFSEVVDHTIRWFQITLI